MSSNLELDISFHVHNDLWKVRLKPYQKTIRNILEIAAREVKLVKSRPGAAKAAPGGRANPRHARSGQKIELSVVLADDAFVKGLNSQYRGKNKSTNVLSFPSSPATNHQSLTTELGDIILAFETIAKEAQEQEKTFRDHAAHLLVHGFLHLLGHDHIDGKEAAIMEDKEVKILKKLGINNPYL